MQLTEMKCVVAEDEEFNRLIIRKDLTDYGGCQNIKDFEDGLLAWNYMQENSDQIDLVVLDKMMPNMTGLQVAQEMKKHPILKGIPIVFQTGFAGEKSIQECIDAGGDLCVIKPYPPGGLSEKITEALDEGTIKLKPRE